MKTYYRIVLTTRRSAVYGLTNTSIIQTRPWFWPFWKTVTIGYGPFPDNPRFFDSIEKCEYYVREYLAKQKEYVPDCVLAEGIVGKVRGGQTDPRTA